MLHIINLYLQKASENRGNYVALVALVADLVKLHLAFNTPHPSDYTLTKFIRGQPKKSRHINCIYQLIYL